MQGSSRREQRGKADGHARSQRRLLHRETAEQRGQDQRDLARQAGIVVP